MKYTGFEIVFQEVPDEVTLAFSISNCPHRCINCHSAYLRDDIGIELTQSGITKLLDKYSGEVSCVCFMGGDANKDDLFNMASFVKQIGLRTAWYSGDNSINDDRFLSVFDYIKVGEYIEKLGGLKQETTNQRLYKITDMQLKDITYKFWRHI